MEQLKKLYQSLNAKQRWSIVIVVAALAAGLFSFERWRHDRDFSPLFSALAAEDAAAMVQKLKEKGVEYRVSENGSSVLVPQAHLAELRLEMASLGLPKTGRIGFEIFDKTNFAVTDFAERVNFRRAVEGELERSVMSLAEVQQARVHVTFPKESVFLDAREPAKASVLVHLRSGAQLSPQNVSAITHLVASAVEGLGPEAVSVVDMRGNLLNRTRKPASAGDSGGESNTALEYQHEIEKELTAKINGTLEPLLGESKFRAGVVAECDMTFGEQSEETFDPSKSVMTSSQRTEDAPGSTSAGGIPGTASNLPRPPVKTNGASVGPSRKVENVTYQSSRTVRHTKLPQGSIKHLSVAVLIDQEVKWEGQGTRLRRVMVPPTPEKLKTIHDVVATLVGFSEERGDQLTVESLPFDSTLNSEPPPQAAPAAPLIPKQNFDLKTLLGNRLVLIGVGCGVALLLVAAGFLALKRRRRNKTAAVVEVAAISGEVVDGDTVTLSDAVKEGTFPLAITASRTEQRLIELREHAAKDAPLLAAILQEWIAEEPVGKT